MRQLFQVSCIVAKSDQLRAK